MMNGDVRQTILQCPGEGHISEPIKCHKNNQQGDHLHCYCFTILATRAVIVHHSLAVIVDVQKSLTKWHTDL